MSSKENAAIHQLFNGSNAVTHCACCGPARRHPKPSACCRTAWAASPQHLEHPHQGTARSFAGPWQPRLHRDRRRADLLKRLNDVQAFATRWVAGRAKKAAP